MGVSILEYGGWQRIVPAMSVSLWGSGVICIWFFTCQKEDSPIHVHIVLKRLYQAGKSNDRGIDFGMLPDEFAELLEGSSRANGRSDLGFRLLPKKGPM